MKMIEDKVLLRIKELMTFNHWSAYRLAKESNLPYSSINNLFNRNTCPSIMTLEKICSGFHISISEFFSFEENPLRNPELTEEEQEIILCFETLSRSDKELFKAYLSGLSKINLKYYTRST